MKDCHPIARGVVGLAAIVLLAHAAFGQKPAAPLSLANLQKALGEEDYAEARRQADGLLKGDALADRQAASLAYGRILLGLGEEEGFRRYRAMMVGRPLEADAEQLMKVYDAWLLALDGRREAAIHVLKAVIDQKLQTRATVEAADVLARLYIQGGDKENAKKAVSTGLEILKDLNPQPAYLESLLRGRVQTGEAKARKLSEQAELLYRNQKYLEAGKLYLQVRKDFPETDDGQAAGFHVGECLVGLNHDQKALDFWRSFVEESPAGPWRGQAQVALVDLVLASFGDPSLAAKHAAAASAALQKGLAQQANESWQKAAFDIHLRQGALALAEGRHKEAASAFAQAKRVAEEPKTKDQSKPSAKMLAGVDRLIAAAQQKVSVLPDDLRHSDAQAATVLAVGNIYNLACQHAQAKAIFEPALDGRPKSASRPLRAFAALGRARAWVGLDEPERARESYRLSLEEFDRASWHDETLRELALLVERLGDTGGTAKAVKKVAIVKKPACGSSRKSSSPPPDQAISGRADALAGWMKLLARYPTSRHVAEAIDHIGILYADMGQWPQAAEHWERLTRDFPESPWSGDAQVRLIDIRLDKQLDLTAALKCAAAAVDWLARAEPATAAVAGRSGAAPPDEVRGDIPLRAGLLAFLDGRSEEAIAWFEKTKAAPPQYLFVSHKHTPAEVERLTKAIRDGKDTTPPVVCRDRGKPAVALMLAGLYQQAAIFDAAIVLCNRVLDGDAARTASRTQRSWALFQRARSRGGLDDADGRNMEFALADYQAAAEADPEAAWAASALFLAGRAEWNVHKKADRAIALWQNVIQQYPESEPAARSAYYIAVTYQWAGRRDEARRCLEDFVRQYPDSSLVAAAQSQLKTIESAPLQTKRNNASKKP